MKLYYASGACSLAPHIIINELNLDIETEKVDLATHTTATGQDYYQINPKGYVPALQLDNGEILTEIVAILLYLNDQKPENSSTNPLEKYRLYEWLAFNSSEIHKTLGALYKPYTTDEQKPFIFDQVNKRLELIDKHLSTNQFLMGNHFSIADAYLFTCSNWLINFNKNFDHLPNFKAYFEKIVSRPSVQTTLQQEGLI